MFIKGPVGNINITVACIIKLNKRIRSVIRSVTNTKFIDLTGLTLRTFSVIVSVLVLLFAVQVSLPIRSPLNAAGPDVTLKVAVTLPPGTITSSNFFEVDWEFKTTDFHPLGTVMLSVTPFTAAPVVFVYVIVVFCEDCGAKV